MKERLELLGYSKHNLETLFKKIVDDYPNYYSSISFTFDDLIVFFQVLILKNIKINSKKVITV